MHIKEKKSKKEKEKSQNGNFECIKLNEIKFYNIQYNHVK